MKASVRDELIQTLKTRFGKHAPRHAGIAWSAVLKKLEAHPDTLKTLAEMERTGGEPDVIGRDAASGEFIFCDCSAESPAGRRSLCYDRAALDARKEKKPAGSAMEMAKTMGQEIIDAEDGRALPQVAHVQCIEIQRNALTDVAPLDLPRLSARSVRSQPGKQNVFQARDAQ